MEKNVEWIKLQSPKTQVGEWVERAVFVSHQDKNRNEWQISSNTQSYTVASLDTRLVEIQLGNFKSWHNALYGRGIVKSDPDDLSRIAAKCCDMVNIEWNYDFELQQFDSEESIKCLGAISLDDRGLYPSLVGPLKRS